MWHTDGIKSSTSLSSPSLFELSSTESEVVRRIEPTQVIQGMKNMKCYGRKKIIIPKEKSFIRNFFDGNESSDIFSDVSEDKNQGVNAKENKENKRYIFESPHLIDEVSPFKQKKRYGLRSVAERNNSNQKANYDENKENVCNIFQSPALCDKDFPLEQEESFGAQNVVKPKQAAKNRCRRNNYARKKIKGIQHLSTKYCKSQQPDWDAFENHEFNIEKPRNNKPLPVIEQQISNIFKNFKQYAQNVSIDNNIRNEKASHAAALPHETPISPKRMKTVASKLDFPSQETLESSGELFTEIPKYRKDLKNKNIKKKKISTRKKQNFKNSHNTVAELEQVINQCMQNIDFSESRNISINAKISNCNEKISNAVDVLPGETTLKETVSIPCSNTIPFVEISPINKGFCNMTDEVSKNIRNLESDSASEMHNISSNNEFLKSFKRNKNTYIRVNSFEGSPYPQQKLPGTFLEVHSHSNNGNFSSGKSADLGKHSSLTQNMPENAAFYKSQQATGSDESQKILLENNPRVILERLHIPFLEHLNVSCRLNTDTENAAFCKSQQATGSDESQKILHENNPRVILERLHIPFLEHLNVSCRLNTDTISDKPICMNENKPNYIQQKHFEERKTNNSIFNADLSHQSQDLKKSSDISLNKNTNSLNVAQKNLKNSICKNNKSNSHTSSPNISSILQTSKSFGLKLKGKFATSTPITSRRKIDNFINAENIVLSDNENLSQTEIYSKQYASFSEKMEENKHSNSVRTETQRNSFIKCPNKSACIEISKSLQCPVTPNFNKSRTSLTVPNKSAIHSVAQKKTQSLLDISSINVLPEREKSDDFTKAKLLKLCDQDSVTPFANAYNWKNFKVKKIGEGTYGEVFMLSKGKTSSVLKVIAIADNPDVKNLQGISSVYSEITISKCLSELRCNKTNQSKNFVKIIRSSIISGSYPAELMKAWDDFSLDRSTYNDRPDVYSEDQLFAILELEYGGKDLSCFTLRNAVEAEVILKQIAVSLAVAEEEFSFEHRDLHLGNILVKRNRSKTVSYKIGGRDISFQCLGLQVTIIDFTLSLLSDQGYIYYYDLAEDSLFDQTGDYQFHVYKSMRKHLENKWEECSLYSNVLWLKYLCKKMKEFKFSHPTAVTHKRGLKTIESFNTQLMKCSCALDCLEKCGITKIAFKKSISDTPRRSILVSRNSVQKSKLSICN